MSTPETQQGFPKITAPLCNNDLTANQVWLQLFITLWNRTGGGSGASTNDALLFANTTDEIARLRDDIAAQGLGGLLGDSSTAGAGTTSSGQTGLTSDILADPPIPPPDPLLAALFDGPPGVTEEAIHLSDFTTNNVSISKHGFVPKAPNDATRYLDGTGAYSVPAGTGGSGTVTSISAGTGITLTPSPITTTGSVAISNTAIAPATYGDATHVGQFTVNQQGQLTSAVAVAITFPSSGDISPFSSDSITKPAAADFTIADDTTGGHGTGSKVDLATRGVELTNTRGAAATTQSLFFESAVANTLVTMIAYVAPNFQETSSNKQYFYGIGVRDNTGKIDSFGLSFNSGVGNTEWQHFTFTNISTAPTIAGLTGGHMANGRPIWLRLQKISTNFVFSVSYNGETYTTVATVSATGFVGATLNDVGVILYNGLATGTEVVNLDVFSFTKS